MDKKYIESLENFSVALEQLVSEMKRMSDAKKEETSPGGTIHENTQTLINISKNIETIKSDVSHIKDQNDQILKNQNTILKIGSSKTPLDDVSDEEKTPAIGKGITTILLMAGAIVALGAAFNIVGDVDMVTVLSLSIAMPLLAKAFSEVAESTKDMDLLDILVTASALVAIAGALMISGWIISSMPIVGYLQLFSALGVALVLGLVISGITIFGFTFGGLLTLFESLSGMNIDAAITVGGILVAIAGSLWAASWALEGMPEFTLDQMVNILGFSTAFALAASLMAIPIWVISKMGLSIEDAAMGGLVILTIAAVISGSSWLLSIGNYDDYPTSDWAAGVGLSMLAFGIPMLALGVIMVATGGIGFLALAAGAASVLILGATIAGASHILGLGDYSNYPNAKWSAGVGLSMLAFGTPILTLGAFILGSFGIGAAVLNTGRDAVLNLSKTVVIASHILAMGNYKDYPTLEWSTGVGRSIGAFSPVYRMIMANGVLSIFGGGVDPEEFNQAIKSLSNSIVVAADTFAEGKGSFENPPPEDWSKGVALAIGAFSPIYETLAGQTWLNRGVDPEDFNEAISSVAKGIFFAARMFDNDVSFTGNYPKKEWGEGVSAAMDGFVPLYQFLDDSGASKKDLNKYNDLIYRMSMGIVNTSLFLQGWFISNGNWVIGKSPIYEDTPSQSWVRGVSTAIKEFGDLHANFRGFFSDVSEGDVIEGNRKVWLLSSGMARTSMLLQYLNTDLDLDYVLGFSEKVGMGISNWGNIFKDVKEITDSDLVESVSRLDKLANGFENLANSLNNLSASIHGFQPEFVSVLSEVSGVNLTVEPALEVQETERSWWDRIFNPVPEEERETKAKVEAMIEPDEAVEEDLKIRDLYEKLDELKSELEIISANSSTLSNYVNELRMGSDDRMKI